MLLVSAFSARPIHTAIAAINATFARQISVLKRATVALMTRNVRAVNVASMCVGVHTAHVEHLSNPVISESIPLTEAKGAVEEA